MVKVIFNSGNKGVTYGKKRKRYPGTNSIIKNEVKQWNPMYGGSDSFDGVSLSNVTNPTTAAQGQGYSWMLYELLNPVEGTEPYNRVGNQYFLKYLRFKGYVRHYGYTPMDINWRLILYRADSIVMTGWSGFYKNTESFPGTDSGYNINTYCRHNFYKKVWDTNFSDSVKKKVIASGCLPRITTGVLHGQRYEAGSSSSFGKIDLWYHDYNSTQECLMPIDIKVTCNDWIHVGKVRYYLCLECDCGSAFQDTGYGNMVPVRGGPNTEQPMDVNFFVRGYFTDP